jgi:hypothetical protein
MGDWLKEKRDMDNTKFHDDQWQFGPKYTVCAPISLGKAKYLMIAHPEGVLGAVLR